MSTNIGITDHLIYDDCAYASVILGNQKISNYHLNQNMHENKNKCKFDNFYHPYDLIDLDSELKNITRPASKCINLQYQGMPKTGKCKTELKPYQTDYIHHHIGDNPVIPHTTCDINGTLYDNSLIGQPSNVKGGVYPPSSDGFHPSVPVVLPPEVCPIVYNNIPKRTCPGYSIPDYIDCNRY